MEQAITIGLDIARHVFHAHGADVAGHVLFRKRLMRAASMLALKFPRDRTRSMLARRG